MTNFSILIHAPEKDEREEKLLSMLSIVLSPRNVYFLISFLFDHISFDATVEATFMCSCAFQPSNQEKSKMTTLRQIPNSLGI